MRFVEFAGYALRQVLVGRPSYYAWLVFLVLVISVGVVGFSQQVIYGHIVSNLRDPVPWGIFIGTYAFFVGVAAAAMALAVPGYVYGWKPIQEIVVLGEIIAISAVEMYDTLRRRGIRYMETNRELEENTAITGIWSKFERVWFRRSRVYRLDLR